MRRTEWPAAGDLQRPFDNETTPDWIAAVMAKRVNKNMVVALTAFAFVLMTAGGILMVL